MNNRVNFKHKSFKHINRGWIKSIYYPSKVDRSLENKILFNNPSNRHMFDQYTPFIQKEKIEKIDFQPTFLRSLPRWS